MRYKKVACAVFSLWAALALAGCRETGEKAETPKETAGQTEEIPSGLCLSMATNGDWSSSFKGEIMEEELKALEERTEGKIRIRLYDRSRLGDDAHLISGVQAGTIDIVQSSPSTQVNAVPEAAFLDVPGLFDSLTDWNRLFEGEYRAYLDACYEKAGLQLLDVFAYSWRNLSSRESVEALSDLNGLRIRTMGNQYQNRFWESLGAQPVSYRYAELYFCLHEGMADAQENLLDVMLSDNLYEVQSSVTLTRHMPMVSVIAMNLERYRELTGEEKEELARFTAGLRTRLMAEMPEEEERILETLEHDYGIAVHTPSGEWKEAIREGSRSVLELLEKELGQESTDAFLSHALAEE